MCEALCVRSNIDNQCYYRGTKDRRVAVHGLWNNLRKAKA
jgi:hypothetical protein